MTLLPIHILSGVIAIAGGLTALLAVKGGTVHRTMGMVFVCAMLSMSGTGAVMAALQPNRGNVMAGLVTFYMVTTALLTTRRGFHRMRSMDIAVWLLGVAIGITGFIFGFMATQRATGSLDGYPPPLYFVFGGLTFFASAGDLRLLIHGVQGRRRLARHVWRMSAGLFIASASFFLGQAKILPKSLRIMPLLALPVLLVLAVMLYWLVRIAMKANPLKTRSQHHVLDQRRKITETATAASL